MLLKRVTQNHIKNYKILLSTTLSLIFDNAYVKNEFNPGLRRADIIVCPKNNKKLGIVLESKYVKTRTSKERLDNIANKAIKQIIDNGYEQELIHLGINNILLIGVGFYKNKLSIKCEHKHLK